MKAEKVTVTIVIEALHIDSVGGLVNEAVIRINSEFENGKQVASDGDSVDWKTERISVEF